MGGPKKKTAGAKKDEAQPPRSPGPASAPATPRATRSAQLQPTQSTATVPASPRAGMAGRAVQSQPLGRRPVTRSTSARPPATPTSDRAVKTETPGRRNASAERPAAQSSPAQPSPARAPKQSPRPRQGQGISSESSASHLNNREVQARAPEGLASSAPESSFQQAPPQEGAPSLLWNGPVLLSQQAPPQEGTPSLLGHSPAPDFQQAPPPVPGSALTTPTSDTTALPLSSLGTTGASQTLGVSSSGAPSRLPVTVHSVTAAEASPGLPEVPNPRGLIRLRIHRNPLERPSVPYGHPVTAANQASPGIPAVPHPRGLIRLKIHRNPPLAHPFAPYGEFNSLLGPHPAPAPSAPPAPEAVKRTDENGQTWFKASHLSQEERTKLFDLARVQSGMTNAERTAYWQDQAARFYLPNDPRTEELFRPAGLAPPMSYTDGNNSLWINQGHISWGERCRLLNEELAAREYRRAAEEERLEAERKRIKAEEEARAANAGPTEALRHSVLSTGRPGMTAIERPRFEREIRDSADEDEDDDMEIDMDREEYERWRNRFVDAALREGAQQDVKEEDELEGWGTRMEIDK